MRIIKTATDKGGQALSLDDLCKSYYTDTEGSKKYGTLQVAIDAVGALKGSTAGEIAFLTYIQKDIPKLFTGIPSEIKAMTEYVDRHFPNLFVDGKGEKTTFHAVVKAALNYGAYRKGEKLFWLSERLQIRTCLYCNAQYALTVSNKGGKQLLFEFDHFYPQKYYPFLALNLYNLIPSCANCNKVKLDQQLDLVHPYAEDASSMIIFKAGNKDVLDFLINDRKGPIKIDAIALDPRMEAHKKTFLLKQVANNHHDLVEELFLKTYYYNDSKQKELATEFKGIINADVVRRFILGNFHLPEDINKRPLAKLTQDIAKDLGLF